MMHVCAFVMGVFLATGLAAQGTKKATAPVLEGTWVVTSLNGQSAPEGTPQLALTFTGDKYQQAIGGQVNERGAFKIDAAKKPVTIDLVINEGDDAGKTQLGIVEVSGETMRMGLSIPGAAQRPTDFTAKDAALLVVAKKLTSK